MQMKQKTLFDFSKMKEKEAKTENRIENKPEKHEIILKLKTDTNVKIKQENEKIKQAKEKVKPIKINKTEINQNLLKILTEIPPKDFDLILPLKYESFFDIVEILELCLYLNEKFEINIKFDRKTIYEDFLENLKSTSYTNSFQTLFDVVFVFITTILRLESEMKEIKENLRFLYTEEMELFKDYLNYLTFSEFVRIFIFKYAYTTNCEDSHRFRQLFTNQEFICFSFINKLWVIIFLKQIVSYI